MTPAQQREVEIYRLTDRIAEQTGRDGPDRPTFEDALLAEAEAAWEAEHRGLVKPWHFTVLPTQDDQGVWGYTAVEPDAKVVGCSHWVEAATRAIGRSMAAVEHQQVCVPVVIPDKTDARGWDVVVFEEVVRDG